MHIIGIDFVHVYKHLNVHSNKIVGISEIPEMNSCIWQGVLQQHYYDELVHFVSLRSIGITWKEELRLEWCKHARQILK